MPEFEWRGRFRDAEGFGTTPDGWWTRVTDHSLGWVCARDADRLVGFVNVAWDGGAHAFLVDTVVACGWRRRGIRTDLVTVAVERSGAAGCQWLHVDFGSHLTGFSLAACGFRSTRAGFIALDPTESPPLPY